MGRAHRLQGTAGIVTGARAHRAQLARDWRRAACAWRAGAAGGPPRALADEIRRGGGEAIAVPCDVAERTTSRAGGGVLERFGRVDLLVNDAAYGRHVLFKDHERGDMNA